MYKFQGCSQGAVGAGGMTGLHCPPPPPPRFCRHRKEDRRTNGQSITNGPPDIWSWLQLCPIQLPKVCTSFFPLQILLQTSVCTHYF